MRNLIEANIDSQLVIAEVVGAIGRCTNITAKTFGICSDEPLIRMADLSEVIFSAFPKSDIYTYWTVPGSNFTLYPNEMEKELEPLDSRSIPEDKDVLAPANTQQSNIYPKLNGVLTKTTTNQFINTIKDQNATGSYVIAMRGHAMAVHYTSKGIYMVDNEEKFKSRRQIWKFLAIDNSKAVTAFNQFLEDNPNSPKIKKI